MIKIISETKPIPFKCVDFDGKLAKVIFVADNNSSFKRGQSQTSERIKCGQSQTFKKIKCGQSQTSKKLNAGYLKHLQIKSFTILSSFKN